MRVAVAGGTGLIGTALVRALRERGDEAVVLSRQPSTDDDRVQWDPSRGIAQVKRLEGLDAFVNLSGASLGTRPWTRQRRRVLLESRLDATEVLAKSLDKLERKPRVWVGVGVLGRFGDHGEGWIDDDDAAATGFLAELAVDWEQAHMAAAESLGARGAVLRMGVVLASEGGVFPLLVRPFRYGFGGWLGNGRQFTAWISLVDCVHALLHLIDTEACVGSFNGSVPDPVPNRDWCKALGGALDKPVRTHAPKWALRGALGDMADGLFLASVRARPRKLLETGFRFVDADLDAVFARLVEEFDGR